MLPVYREASMHGQSLWAQRDVWQSGACELHLVLCQSLSIQNYPTVVLYLGREQELVLHIGVFDSSTFVNSHVAGRAELCHTPARWQHNLGKVGEVTRAVGSSAHLPAAGCVI